MDFFYDLRSPNTALAGGAGSAALRALPKPSQKVTVVKVRPCSSVMLPLNGGQSLKARLPADTFLWTVSNGDLLQRPSSLAPLAL